MCSRRDEMLVHLFVLLHVIAFCHGKSLDYSGKSYHNQGAEPVPQPEYYYPQIDGQPIYVPSIGHSSSDMNKLLDDYYRRYPTYTHSWAHPTPGPYDYQNAEGDYYESPVTSNSMVTNYLASTDEDDHRGNYHILTTESQKKYEPPVKPKLQYDYEESKEYEDKKIVDEKSYEKDHPSSGTYKMEKVNTKKENKLKETKDGLDDYDEPLVQEKIKTKKQEKDIPIKDIDLTENDDEYEPPVVRERIKTGDKSVPKTKPELEKETDYEEPVIYDRVKVKKYDDKNSYVSKADTKLEKGDDSYEEPVVYDRINIKKYDEGKSYPPEEEPELENEDYKDEKPAEKENLKQEKKEAKQEKKTVKTSSKSNVKANKKSNKGKRKKQSNSKSKEYPATPSVEKENPKKVKEEIEESYSENELKKTKSAAKKPSLKMKNKVKTKPKVSPAKTQDKVKIESKEPPVKTKDKIKPEQKEKVDEVGIKSGYEDSPVKTKDKVKPEPKETVEKDVVKSESKEKPVKIKEKVVVKSESKEKPVKIKEKVVVKSESKEKPVKIKEKVVVKSESQEKPVKNKEKVVIKSKPKVKPVKSKDQVEKVDSGNEYEADDPDYAMNGEKEDASDIKLKPFSNPVSEDTENAENLASGNEFENVDEDNEDRPLKEEEKPLMEIETSQNSKTPKFLHNDAVRRLSSLNANIWSLIFNPNAEGLKLKKCLTRTNETGYCTYVQNCEVPDIATSLEQLLNNGCVIDDIFIGVCCPEFPVETVKVHWEDEVSNSGKQSEAEFDESVDDCGIRSSEAAKQQSWPWKAPLVSMSNGKIFCGGVIISDNYVLTAAHCTTKIPKNQILVRLGQFDASTGDDYAVVEIKRHAQYNPRTMHNDIALLKLGRRIIKDEHTGIICLPDEDDDEDEHEGEKAILLGWKGKLSKSKKTEFLEVMEKDECKKKLRTNVPKTMLCTEARNEDERTCNADSGAPLVIEDDGKYEVIGILSWNRNDCDERFPSTFSRVSPYVGWIRKHAV